MQRSHKSTRRWHRWLAGILGIQLSLWILSGVYFSWVPIETVRGTDLKTAQDTLLLSEQHQYIPVQRALEQYHASNAAMPQRAELVVTDSAALYRLFDADNHLAMQVNALTGIVLPRLSAQDAQDAAQRDYDGNFAHKATALLTDTAPQEYRGPLPVYQVRVDDWRGTRLYVSPIDGQVLSRRNHYWRIFDFLWMLHIMDFDTRDDFNNPLLRGFATASLSIVVTGYVLICYRRRRNATRNLS